MIAWVLAEFALKSTAVLLMCVAVVWLLRHQAASMRHAAWSVGLATVLILGPLCFMTPSFTVPVTLHALGAGAGGESIEAPHRGADRVSGDGRASRALLPGTLRDPIVSDHARARSDRSHSAQGAGHAAIPPSSDEPFSTRNRSARVLAAALQWTAVLVPWVWLLGSVLLLCQIVRSRIRLGRLRLQAAPIADSRVLGLADEVRRSIGLTGAFELRWSRHVRTPVAFGAVRATVMLPCEASAWSAERIRVVITHELSHIRRRDPWTQLVAELARAVHWYNPVVWYAVRRSMLERERACDDQVVEGGVPGIDYAEHLISMAERLTRRRAFPKGALTMAEGGDLEARITSLLSPAVHRNPLTRKQLCVVAIPALLAASILTATGLRPDVADAHRSEPSSSTSPGAVRATGGPMVEIFARPSRTPASEPPHASEAPRVLESSGPAASDAGDAADASDAAPDRAAMPTGPTRPAEDAAGLPLGDPASERADVSNPRARWPSDQEIQSSPERDFILRLRAAADHEKSWEYDLVRERSEWALTRVRHGRIVAPLIESLADPDWRIQAYAAWALAAIDASSASESIRPLLDHSKWRVRAQAASSLLQLGSGLPLETLRRLGRDEAWQVRIVVVEFLQKTGGTEARQLLEQMRADPHSGTRMQVETALAELADR